MLTLLLLTLLYALARQNQPARSPENKSPAEQGARSNLRRPV